MSSLEAPPHPAAPMPTRFFFERRELDRLLWLYGQMVAAGHWRDYAIDGLADRAVFSVYRRASEHPLYQIEKRPALARRQGAFALIGQHGQILKRGHELDPILRMLAPKPVRGVDESYPKAKRPGRSRGACTLKR